MEGLANQNQHKPQEQHQPPQQPHNASLDKWRYTLYTTVVLLILFNPWMYKIMNKLLSRFVGAISNKDGCPTMLGFGIHTLVFTLILRALMDMRI